ncbi:hypothetical protein, partial [Methylacidiphilum caldifontis]|uniref:hypothetical protein n=1 Tax=Methylacidiphilum caldifontis TaxID=2795386 RepID=UPI001ABD0E43
GSCRRYTGTKDGYALRAILPRPKRRGKPALLVIWAIIFTQNFMPGYNVFIFWWLLIPDSASLMTRAIKTSVQLQIPKSGHLIVPI